LLKIFIANSNNASGIYDIIRSVENPFFLQAVIIFGCCKLIIRGACDNIKCHLRNCIDIQLCSQSARSKNLCIRTKNLVKFENMNCSELLSCLLQHRAPNIGNK